MISHSGLFNEKRDTEKQVKCAIVRNTALCMVRGLNSSIGCPCTACLALFINIPVGCDSCNTAYIGKTEKTYKCHIYQQYLGHSPRIGVGPAASV